MRRTDREITDAEKRVELLEVINEMLPPRLLRQRRGVYRAAEFRLRRGKRKAGVLFSQR